MLTMPGIDFDAVARAITCQTFAKSEMVLNRAGRAQCPFHGGRDHNLAFYNNGKCHCFVCGRTANSVQLAGAVWRLSELDAARELSEQFNLGISTERMTAEERARRDAERAAERARKAEDLRRERAAWGRAADNLRNAERDLWTYQIGDVDKPAFGVALMRFSIAQDRWSNLWATAGRR